MSNRRTGFFDALMFLVIVVPWLAGIVIAKGKVAVAAAIFIAPYAWYLVVEKLMLYYDLI